MAVRGWRLLTIMLVALSMSAAVAHLLEMPAKLGFDGAFWLRLNQNLYGPGFGTFGAAFEVGAVLTTCILVVLVRRRRHAFGWTVLGAATMVAAHAVFWLLVAPVNATIAPLTPETLPADWTRLRAQWEWSHAARAVLQIVALGSLALSVLAETRADDVAR